MTVPRCSWGESFYWRYEQAHSLRHLEESILNMTSRIDQAREGCGGSERRIEGRGKQKKTKRSSECIAKMLRVYIKEKLWKGKWNSGAERFGIGGWGEKSWQELGLFDSSCNAERDWSANFDMLNSHHSYPLFRVSLRLNNYDIYNRWVLKVQSVGGKMAHAYNLILEAKAGRSNVLDQRGLQRWFQPCKQVQWMIGATLSYLWLLGNRKLEV